MSADHDGTAMEGQQKRLSGENLARTIVASHLPERARRPVGIGTCLLVDDRAVARAGVAGLRRASPSASLDKSARIFGCRCRLQAGGPPDRREYTRQKRELSVVDSHKIVEAAAAPRA